MPSVEKMSIALTPEMANAVREAVERGEYVSASEVIRDALREWQLRRSLYHKELEEMKRLWQEGADSGSGQYADMDSIKAEARRRMEQVDRAE